MTISMDKRYQTRDGREVRLYSVTGGGSFQIHGAYFNLDTGEWRVDAWTIEGRARLNGETEYDLIEIRTAEDVVWAALDNWGVNERESKPCQPVEFDICRALRDAGKMRDGE